MRIYDRHGRLTLGGLMVIIAMLGWIMGWYISASRENARTLEAELAAADAELKRSIAENEAQAAKDEEMERKADEAMARGQEALARSRAMADGSEPPQGPPTSSIPGQVKNLVNLLDERKKLEAKSKRLHEEIASKMRERMEKQRLEAVEQPR